MLRLQSPLARGCGRGTVRRFAYAPSKLVAKGTGGKQDEFQYLQRLREECARSSERWQEARFRAPLEATLDFRYPAEWYPSSRTKRTIYCHVGPTNSGKTHAAIQKLREAKRGVYCAPLRLLAMEMWAKLNALNKACALRTGEITSGPPDRPDVGHEDVDTLACTVEMLDLGREFDVAVIDEIQLLADDSRGWAFTQALLGVNAREIYVCGEEAAVNLVRHIAAETGDRVEVIRYERLSPLVVADRSLDGQLDNLRPGDCAVAFSRKKIFQTKYLIESKTGQKCSVVYGNLPMENRTMQAKQFNERLDGVKIMVASDAVGMGLNLNIQRIVFLDVKQSNGERVEPVPPSRIKQIGGRAGRFGFGNSQGVVTCLHDADMDYMVDCMAAPNEEYRLAGLAPPAAAIVSICQQFPDLSLSAVLSAIASVGKFGKHYEPCISREQILLAHLLEAYPSFSMDERLTLSAAPVNMRDIRVLHAYQWFVSSIAARRECPLRIDLGHHHRPMDYLAMAESFYRTLDLYLWLATRYPKLFVERDKVMEKREMCSALVNSLLGRITVKKAPPLPDMLQGRIRGSVQGSVHGSVHNSEHGSVCSDDTPTRQEADLDDLDRVLRALDDPRGQEEGTPLSSSTP